MEKYLNFLKIELKRGFRYYPKILLVAISFAAFFFFIFFVSNTYLQEEKEDFKIKIAVVQEESDTTLDMALMYVKSIKTVANTCDIQTMEYEQAFEELNNNKIAAILYLPKNVIGGVINGTNTPAKVFFPPNATIETRILTEFINPAIRMLQVAQAQIYATYDLAREYGYYDYIYDYQDDINEYNLDFAINRLDIYKNHTLSKTDNLNMIEHYVLYGFVAFLFLFSMALYPIMKNYNKAFLNQAERFGVSPTSIYVNQAISSVLIYVLVFIPFYVGIHSFMGEEIGFCDIGISSIASLLVTFVFVVSFAQMFYQLGGGNVTSILAIFFSSVLMVYVSGGIIPSIYLPNIVQRMGKLSPTTYVKNVLECLYMGKVDTISISILFWIGLLCWIIPVVVQNKKRKVFVEE